MDKQMNWKINQKVIKSLLLMGCLLILFLVGGCAGNSFLTGATSGIPGETPDNFDFPVVNKTTVSSGERGGNVITNYIS